MTEDNIIKENIEENDTSVLEFTTKEDSKTEKTKISDILGVDDDLPEEIKKKLEKNKAAKAKTVKGKKKKKVSDQKIKNGCAYIKATYNNTIVSLTDSNGNVISWASAGVAGFKGAKKSTPYAAQIITKIASMKAKEVGLEEINVFINGVGNGRESAVRALNANGFIINSIKDITPVPHNGCRPKKPRRV